MSSENDDELIAATVDENGDEVPQDHPIENPEEEGDDGASDPIAEPHPDEPGAPDDAGEETSQPGDD